MADPVNCKICGFGFREETMKDGKCDLCAKLYPKANSLQEAKESKNPKADKLNEGHMHKVIVEKIYDVLVNEGILTECECGKKYYRTSPAQKHCKSCKEKKSAEKVS